MSENVEQPIRKRSEWRKWPTWVVVGVFIAVSGIGQVYHGIKTMGWPLTVDWIDYFDIGTPQIVVGVLEIIVGVAMLACAIVKGRFQFSLRDLLWAVTFLCLGSWLLVSLRQINEHPVWFSLAVMITKVSAAAAAGMYSASRSRRQEP